MNKKIMMVPVLALAFSLTACGGGDDDKDKKKVSASQSAARTAWAQQVCAPEVSNSIKASNDALADVLKVIPGESAEAGRNRLAGNVTALANADTALVTALEKAGDPAVPDGAKLRTEALDALRASAGGWNDLKARIEALPVDDQNKFQEQLRPLAPDLGTAGANTTAALQKLHQGELGKALAAVPDCAPLPSVAPSVPSAPSETPPAVPSETPPAAPSETPPAVPSETPPAT